VKNVLIVATKKSVEKLFYNFFLLLATSPKVTKFCNFYLLTLIHNPQSVSDFINFANFDISNKGNPTFIPSVCEFLQNFFWKKCSRTVN